MAITIRRAGTEDAAVAADIFLRARHRAAADGSIPPIVGDDNGARRYWATVVEGNARTYLAIDDSEAVAVMVLENDWVDHLYVAPGHTNQGIGARLLNLAKDERPDGLQLWAFVSNTGARRFYERHGFVEVEWTDGADNMEKAPDVRLAWRA